MITMAKNPKMKQLFKINNKINSSSTVWSKIGRCEILTHRSWVSLWLIIEWALNNFDKEEIVLYVPEYYCYDTLLQIEKNVHIVYYPINDKLEPDISKCRELAKNNKPNIFLHVHFWGKIMSVNDSFVFCNIYNAVLIEDAVHVLFPDKRIGKKSDFILFSPWKLLGLPDGAVMLLGKQSRFFCDDDKAAEVCNYFNSCVNKFNAYDSYILKWKLKRILLKIIPMIGKNNLNTIKSLTASENRFAISKYSKNLLLSFTEKELLEIGERRKENAWYLYDYCKRRCQTADLLVKISDIPYMLPILITDPKDKALIVNDLNRVGKVISNWPKLSDKIDCKSAAKQFADNTIAIAVHDNLSVRLLNKRLNDNIKFSSDSNINIKISEISCHEYDMLCDSTQAFIPLLQSSRYALAKNNAQSWKQSFWVIKNNETAIGCFLALSKKMLISVYRINGGPIWFKPYDEKIKALVYREIVRHFSGGMKILFIAPGEERSGSSLALMARSGMVYRSSFYATGYIDLFLDEDNIRNNLNSKWRNQLKASERAAYNVEYLHDFNKLNELLCLHIKHKNEAEFDDAGDSISRELLKSNSIMGMCAKNKDNMVCAFVFIALHCNSATYFIGWSNDEGRKNNLNKLLLWNAILKLKEKGYHWFDLGGIDFINTPNIAEFKMGMGCRYFEFAGEFIKF